MTTVEQCIAVRAQEVARWLDARFAWRDVWLAAELYLEASQARIDLGTWLGHPDVMRVGVVRERVAFPGVGMVTVFHRGIDDPVRLEPSCCRAAIEGAILADDQRAALVAAGDEPPVPTCEVVDPEVVAS